MHKHIVFRKCKSLTCSLARHVAILQSTELTCNKWSPLAKRTADGHPDLMQAAEPKYNPIPVKMRRVQWGPKVFWDHTDYQSLNSVWEYTVLGLKTTNEYYGIKRRRIVSYSALFLNASKLVSLIMWLFFASIKAQDV